MALQSLDATVSIMTGRPEFDFRQEQEFSLRHFVDTGAGPTSLSDSVDTERYFFYLGKAAGALTSNQCPC
jgi:hypothetical protein